MTKKTDIESIDHIKLMVDTFYDNVREDQLLGPVFDSKIKDWNKHLANMYNFWESLLLQNPVYGGAPFAKHVGLPVNEEHFKTWTTLFDQTIDNLFQGPKADEAKMRAGKIAMVFLTKLSQMDLLKYPH